MTHAEIIILNYLLNSLWQVPVIFLAATLAARLTRSAGPQTEHRLWVAALILEITLPACAFAPALRSLFSSLINNRAGHVTTQITILNATAAHNPSHLGNIAASTALIAYAALLIYFTARLLYRIHRTRALRRSAQLISLSGDLLTLWQRCARIFGVHDAQLADIARHRWPLHNRHSPPHRSSPTRAAHRLATRGSRRRPGPRVRAHAASRLRKESPLRSHRSAHRLAPAALAHPPSHRRVARDGLRRARCTRHARHNAVRPRTSPARRILLASHAGRNPSHHRHPRCQCPREESHETHPQPSHRRNLAPSRHRRRCPARPRNLRLRHVSAI